MIAIPLAAYRADPKSAHDIAEREGYVQVVDDEGRPYITISIPKDDLPFDGRSSALIGGSKALVRRLADRDARIRELEAKLTKVGELFDMSTDEALEWLEMRDAPLKQRIATLESELREARARAGLLTEEERRCPIF